MFGEAEWRLLQDQSHKSFDMDKGTPRKSTQRKYGKRERERERERETYN